MSVASAEVGDVYYCQSSEIVQITPDKVEKFKGQRFAFKRNEKEIVFGKEVGFFEDTTIKLKSPSLKEWFFGDPDQVSYFHYKEGAFVYSMYVIEGNKTVTVLANCNTFQ
tara:strand:- start:185 stop:514 length:330 start_codon:yes stop_codon:yes gene_type:complete